MIDDVSIYTLPEFALSMQEGYDAYLSVEAILEAGQHVTLALEDCHVLTTHWLSGFFGPLFDRLGLSVEQVRARVEVRGASRTNQQAIDLLFQVATEYNAREGQGDERHT